MVRSRMNDASRPVRPAGLSQADAAARLAAEGPNELPGGGRRSMLHVIADVLREPMLLLLIGAGVIYLVLGELYDALILMAFAGLSIVIAIVQEARTERAIDALRDLSLPHATVVRDGERSRIPSREVVRGDLLAVSEGSRIAADGWIFEAEGLHADEAILTGESVTVTKRALAGEPGNSPPLPGGNDLPYAYSGTLAVRGTGLVLVDATGPHSRIGQIGQSLASLETETPRLTLQTRRLVRWLAAFGLVVSVLAVLLYGFLRGGWLEAMLSGIAIAMSMLPEELPIVLTLFMTMGAFRMSRARVLARRGTAIETLGAATVLCTDKTGTLTENRMEIADLWLPDGQVFQPGSEDALLSDDHVGLARTGLLACLEEPFDPMEKAFHDLAATLDGARANYTLEKQYPITPDLLAMTHVWSQEDGSELIVAAKGAPETIADLCKLEAVQREDMEDSIAQMASHGLRVLAVASARWSGAELPDAQDGFAFEYRGLVGLADPLRQSVPGAVAELQEAGIRVVMITGDYPATAAAIAKQAGIATGRVMTGEEIARTDDDDLARHIAEVSVFARVMPEQKLRIVRALKAAGEVVAMTGDGV
ncbi:MAG: HAD-IC family P-type ATPase, partial [Novosphingobium sp.]|nr:HAD-IC family P-type ATPase [Novosphingobium sp.]